MERQRIVVAVVGLTMLGGGIAQFAGGAREVRGGRTPGPMRVVHVETARGLADAGPRDATTHFAPSDPKFHLIVAVADGVAKTPISASWWALDAAGAPGQPFSETRGTLEGGDATLDFTVTATKPWPVGRYRADVALDGKVVQSAAFEVVAPVPATAR